MVLQPSDATVEPDPTSYNEAMRSAHKERWLEAWKIVDTPERQKAIRNRWVFTIKRNPDGSILKYKARLVAKGFQQEEGIDYKETFSALCRYESIRTLVAIAATEKLHMKQFDVSTAFLHGKIDEDLYIFPPQGLEVPEGESPKAQEKFVWSETISKVLARETNDLPCHHQLFPIEIC